MKIYPESFEIIKEINQKLKEGSFEGRVADNGVNLVFLTSMIANAGNGDHVEIGTLFGASAIAVALIKKKLELEGDVYCIDPYDAEQRSADTRLVDTKDGVDSEDQSFLNATPEALRKNAKLFDVKLTLIQKSSDPWPEELKDNHFASAYIDGNHLYDMPYKDFMNVSERTSDYIGFDNYEEGYPDVLGGLNKALNESEDWVLFYKNASFAALRRRLPPRGQMSKAPVTAL